MLVKMAAVILDFTTQAPVEFSGSSEEDISYAKNFWQSIQLQPPMESRLVSSDIKQRLKVAPPSSQARNISQSIPEDTPAAVQDCLSRAKTIEHLEEYSRLQKFIEAKVEDKSLLQKHREIRKKKEEISRNKVKVTKEAEEKSTVTLDEYEQFDSEADAMQQIQEFEENKFGPTADDSD